jgi:hypothetical protein
MVYFFETTFPLTAYTEAALEMAHYDKLKDGSFAGEISKLRRNCFRQITSAARKRIAFNFED